MNVEIRVNVGKPILMEENLIYDHVHKIISEKLKKFNIIWLLDEEKISAPQKKFNDKLIEDIFYELFDDITPKIKKWNKKIDNLVGLVFIIFYIGLNCFFVNAYKQTHGMTALIIFGIAFVFLFVPWWYHPFKSFFRTCIEKYYPPKI